MSCAIQRAMPASPSYVRPRDRDPSSESELRSPGQIPTERIEGAHGGQEGKPALGPPPADAKRAGRSRIRMALVYVGLAAAVGLVAWLLVRALLPPTLPVVAVRQEAVSRMLAVTGRIEARQSVVVAARSAGRITAIERLEGQRVEAGDVLARLEDTAARAGVTRQTAEVESVRKELEQKTRDLARAEQLAQKGALSQDELEDVRLSVERGKQDMAGLSAALREQQTQLTVLAPFSGTIVRRDAEIGQVVGPETPLFEIATVDEARVTAEIDERYIAALKAGMQAQVLPLGTDRDAQPAQVSYVAQAVDPQTGAATVRFSYKTQPPEILVGASVDVNISVGSVPNALVIPRESIGTVQGRSFVLVVKDGVAQRREVSVDDWPAEWVVITRGLKASELVAIDPRGASPGSDVRVEVQRAL